MWGSLTRRGTWDDARGMTAQKGCAERGGRGPVLGTPTLGKQVGEREPRSCDWMARWQECLPGSQKRG